MNNKKYIVGLLIIFYIILELKIKYLLVPYILYIAEFNVCCLLPIIPAIILSFYDPKSDRGRGPGGYIKDYWVFLAFIGVLIFEFYVYFIKNIPSSILTPKFLSFYTTVLMTPWIGGISFIFIASYLSALIIGIWIYIFSKRLGEKFIKLLFFYTK